MKIAARKPSLVDRPLGSTENTYWLLDKLYRLNFVVFAEIEGSLDGASLKAALAAVQAENPMLRARIVHVDGTLWFKPAPDRAAGLLPEVLGLRHRRGEIENPLHTPLRESQYGIDGDRRTSLRAPRSRLSVRRPRNMAT